MPFQFRKEAIEEDLNTNFPSQGQGNPPLYYSLSEVVVPTYNINNVAEGSSLPVELQQAWDFSTGFTSVTGVGTSLITNTGFWKVDLTCTSSISAGSVQQVAHLFIDDGVSTKTIWSLSRDGSNNADSNAVTDGHFIVYLKSGETLKGTTSTTSRVIDVWYRQIADINGNLVNPLGFSFA